MKTNIKETGGGRFEAENHIRKSRRRKKIVRFGQRIVSMLDTHGSSQVYRFRTRAIKPWI